jgi:hypothetical protein
VGGATATEYYIAAYEVNYPWIKQPPSVTGTPNNNNLTGKDFFDTNKATAPLDILSMCAVELVHSSARPVDPVHDALTGNATRQAPRPAILPCGCGVAVRVSSRGLHVSGVPRGFAGSSPHVSVGGKIKPGNKSCGEIGDQRNVDLLWPLLIVIKLNFIR